MVSPTFDSVKFNELYLDRPTRSICLPIRLPQTDRTIGLITVFDAILTGRQSGQKLQCLYGSPIAINFFQN